MGRNNVKPRFKAGDIVEVWDMSVAATVAAQRLEASAKEPPR